jgi:hypothetical protein
MAALETVQLVDFGAAHAVPVRFPQSLARSGQPAVSGSGAIHADSFRSVWRPEAAALCEFRLDVDAAWEHHFRPDLQQRARRIKLRIAGDNFRDQKLPLRKASSFRWFAIIYGSFFARKFSSPPGAFLGVNLPRSGRLADCLSGLPRNLVTVNWPTDLPRHFR